MTRLDTKQKVILSVIFILIVLALTLLIGKVTYSYLGPDIDDQIVTEGEVTASEDTLIFSKGNSLSLRATTDNFNSTSGNMTSTVNPTAKLVASNKNNNATAKYNAGFMIMENTYQYSTSGKTAELILTVKDETGATISSAEGLTYVTVNGVSGFDITGKTGAFTVSKDHTIATTSSTTGTTQKWTFTLTFINYTTDQSINENANLQMDIVLQKELIELTIDKMCVGKNFATCLKNNYTMDESIIFHGTKAVKGTVAVTNSSYSAKDESYRYTGSNDIVHNYVCFGSDSATCENDNLYRIMGVFDNKLKLIKSDYANSNMLGMDGNYSATTINKSDLTTYLGKHDIINLYYGNKTGGSYGSNNWETSLLNTTNLNINYINYLNNQNTKWVNMIIDTKWNIGGSTSESYVNSNFSSEKTKKTSTLSKIGLMSLSDYEYAANSSNWNKNSLINYNKNNWMYMGVGDWTLTPRTSNSTLMWNIMSTGGLSSVAGGMGNNAVRPVFFLNSNVILLSGNGTQDTPYRIALQ